MMNIKEEIMKLEGIPYLPEEEKIETYKIEVPLSEEEISEATAKIVWERLSEKYNNDKGKIGKYLNDLLVSEKSDNQIIAELTELCDNECETSKNNKACTNVDDQSVCSGIVSFDNLLKYYKDNRKLSPPPLSSEQRRGVADFIARQYANTRSLNMLESELKKRNENESAKEFCDSKCSIDMLICDPILFECIYDFSIGELKDALYEVKAESSRKELAEKTKELSKRIPEAAKITEEIKAMRGENIPFAYDQPSELELKAASALLLMKEYGKKSFPNHWADPRGFTSACEKACDKFDDNLAFMAEFKDTCTINREGRYLLSSKTCQQLPRQVELDKYLYHMYDASDRELMKRCKNNIQYCQTIESNEECEKYISSLCEKIPLAECNEKKCSFK